MRVSKKKYDFAGWVTKNDILCADGVVIKHDAFRENHGQQVPLVWNHDYNTPENVLGHIILENQPNGVYGYGYFNDSEQGISAREAVKHGDISGLSIGARKIKKDGNNVIHGLIYEVSLVMATANPGAMIEEVITHSDTGESEAIIWTGTLIHSADDILEPEEEELDDDEKDDIEDEELEHADKGDEDESDDETIEDVINTMSDKQKDAVYALLGVVGSAKAEPEDDDDKGQNDDKNKNDDKKGDDDTMKQNVFSKGTQNQNDTIIKHSAFEALKVAKANKVSSLRDVLAQLEVKNTDGEVLTHGINSIEMLFPEAAHSTNGNTPILYKDPNTAYAQILDGVTKSPFSKVRTLIADLTEEEARAKGYIKGDMKKEEYFSLVKRETSPTTVYKKQKLDRDDILDIQDFDVVAFMNVEMQVMLKEEVARAILVGDGRDFSAEDKINELNIRPIISDNEFFTIHKSYADAGAFIETVIKAMGEYRGSGLPTMYIDPVELADVKLLKAEDGRFLFGDIPSNDAIATRLGLKEIVPTTFMTGNGALIVNLRDYTLGATKGGQITNFDDFDIDFNQYKYLIETRLSGALTMPKSAISLQKTTAITGKNDADGGLTYGKRQADKTEPIGQ